MLDPALSEQLKGFLTNVRQPIELVSALDDSPKSQELAELLDEIAGLSTQVTHVRDDSDGGDDTVHVRRPSFRIVRAGTDVHVTFAGIPLGHEFTSLVLALLHVGGHPPKVDEDTAAQVKALTKDLHFETYMSLSCQNCPDVVQALNIMSVLNPEHISHVAIEGGVFQDEVAEKGIQAVPTVYLNGELFDSGRMSLEQILGRVDEGADAKAAAKVDAMEPFETLIVGGGPAGASAAIYLARKGLRTGVVAERFGGQLNDTMSIENYPSVAHTEGPRMAADLEQHVRSYGVEVVLGQHAARLVPAEQPGGLHTVELASGASLQARTVVVATGARWRTMGCAGEEDYRNKGVTFCPHCDGPLFKGKRVAVIGGGNSGVEAAIDLAGVVGHVTVLEFLDTMRADDILQDKLRSLPNVDIALGRRTTEVVGDGTKVTGLRHEPREGGDATTTELDGVFVQIGLLPNTEWVKGVLEVSDRGEIVVDARGGTSIPGVFAAGDCTTVPYKQITIASGAGATAALSAFDHLIRTPVPAKEAVAAG
ncbi:MAG: alkyl hydroperoxide reductase subunit F [Actinobacteria bacterium]|jgi:alkyl hydroperoxide reductase, F subunit|nr:alkyl hydroperoxide reductase subunit F [Actinomycetota bacterium]